MSVWDVAAVVLLLPYGAPILATTLCIIGSNRDWVGLPRIAKAAVWLGAGVIALSLIACVASLVSTQQALQAPGLDPASAAKISAVGYPEAAYNLLFGLLAGLPGVLIGRNTLKQLG